VRGKLDFLFRLDVALTDVDIPGLLLRGLIRNGGFDQRQPLIRCGQVDDRAVNCDGPALHFRFDLIEDEPLSGNRNFHPDHFIKRSAGRILGEQRILGHYESAKDSREHSQYNTAGYKRSFAAPLAGYGGDG